MCMDNSRYVADVFISYSHTNKEWVEGWLLPHLEQADLRTCIDFRDFDLGVPKLVNIERAIDNSRSTLLVLTPALVENEWDEFHSLLAQSADPAGRRRRLIPLLLERCVPPRRIAMLTYADFTRTAQWDHQIQCVVQAIRGELNLAELGPRLSHIVEPDIFLAPSQPHYELVGRDDMLRNLKRRLLATGSLALSALKGLPGVGKTALAVELAHDPEVWEGFPDGVLWIGLGHEADPFSLLGSWALALGMSSDELGQLTTVEDRAQAILTAIGTKRMLLVIDDAWSLEAALTFQVGGPNCAYLLTTRLPEVALRFAGQAETVVELTGRDGRKLLEQLALDVVAAESDAAQELVQAVGGLPLALVIMGNYLRVQGHTDQPRRIHQALEKLQEAEARLQLAEPQPPARQHPSLPVGASISLQAIIQVSDEALDNTAQYALRALSIFPPKANTFSEEAALAVCNASIEILDRLTDSGLLESSGPGRYMLHQTIADYGKEKLIDGTVYERRAEFFVTFAEKAELALKGPEKAAWLAQLETEHDNLRAVLLWSQKVGKAEVGLQLAGSLGRFWWLHGHLNEGLRWLGLAQSQDSNVSAAVRAKALYNAGRLADHRGDFVMAQSFLSESLVIYRELGDKHGIATSLYWLGVETSLQGDFEVARDLLEQSLVVYRELEDKYGIADAVDFLGYVALEQDNYPEARVLLQQSVSIFKKVRNMLGIANSTHKLGMLARHEGNYGEAHTLLKDSLKIFREQDHKVGIASSLYELGLVAMDQGDYAEARTHFEESMAKVQELGAKEGVAHLLEGIGALAAIHQQLARASQLFGAAEALREDIGAPVPPGSRSAYERNIDAVRTQMDEESFAEAWAEGRSMTMEQAVEYALEETAST